MGIWSALFGRKALSLEEIRLWLGELESLAALECLLPATERLKMADQLLPRQAIREGGALHDRFKTVMNRILSRGVEYAHTHGNEPVRITPAWECLPSVILVPCEFETGDIEGGDIIERVRRSPGKDYVVLATRHLNVREREPGRQMEQFFRFKDQPRMAMMCLPFCGTIFVRASFLLLPHGEDLDTLNLEGLLVTCGTQAVRLGFTCKKIA